MFDSLFRKNDEGDFVPVDKTGEIPRINVARQYTFVGMLQEAFFKSFKTILAVVITVVLLAIVGYQVS